MTRDEFVQLLRSYAVYQENYRWNASIEPDDEYTESAAAARNAELDRVLSVYDAQAARIAALEAENNTMAQALMERGCSAVIHQCAVYEQRIEALEAALARLVEAGNAVAADYEAYKLDGTADYRPELLREGGAALDAAREVLET
jgi:hypothetical protein